MCFQVKPPEKKEEEKKEEPKKDEEKTDEPKPGYKKYSILQVGLCLVQNMNFVLALKTFL